MEKLFYLAQVFDGLNTVGIVFLVISAIALLTLIIAKYVNKYEYEVGEDDEDIKIFSKWIRRCWWILIFSIIFTVFIPEKKTFLFMIGGKAVDTLVDKTDIEEIPGNTINLLNEYIKAETENVKNKNTATE